ncbi:MAG: S8 family serine peptidase [Candidatus Heimdallarchaeota archaeon]
MTEENNERTIAKPPSQTQKGGKKISQRQTTPKVALPSSVDRNRNKIADNLEKELIRSQNTDVDVLIGFSHKPTPEDREFIERLGGKWKKDYQVVWVASATLPADTIQTVADRIDVSAIEQNGQSQAFLQYSTKQIRARGAAWNTLTNGATGANYTGNADFSTAVLDTGVDATHPDLSSRVIAWADFVGANVSEGGNAYPSYSDYGHHGTHVASIISGQGNMSRNSHVNVTQSGTITTTARSAWFGPSFELFNSNSVSINVSQYWLDADPTFVGLYGESGWVSSSDGDTNGDSSWIAPLNSPGNYSAMVGGNNDSSNTADDRPYSSQTSYPFTTPPGPYGSNTGVAPNSKIVALKVLDDSGSGNASALLDAYDWCIASRATYNITVISMSLGFSSILSSIDTATAELVNNHGFVVVVSAGNNGPAATRINSPGSTPEAVTVGAVNRYNEVAYYSSNGDPTENNIVVKPDVTAPGGSYAKTPNSSAFFGFPIIAADSNDDDEWTAANGSSYWVDSKSSDHYSNDYRGMQGTSMAAPHVAGLAQLVIQRLAVENNGNWTWSASNAKFVKQLICMATSESASLLLGGEYNFGASLWQNPTLNRGSKDYVEGWGRIDANTSIHLFDKQTLTGGSWTATPAFSDGINDPRVYGYRFPLVAGRNYNFSLDITQSDDDLDIFLYSNSTTSYGEPLELDSSKNTTFGTDEVFIYAPSTSGDYYYVVRWANGTGAAPFTLKIEDLSPPHSLSSPTVLTPNGGESINRTYIANWSASTDSEPHLVTYAVYYSTDGGSSWTQLVTGLADSSYPWNTTLLGDGTNFLLNVTATCSLGLIASDVSDSMFTIQNDFTNFPVHIRNDAEFTFFASQGNGSLSNPYIIEEQNITRNSTHLIWIEDTTAHFIIRNNHLDGVNGSYSGIILENVLHGLISNNTIHSIYQGIWANITSELTITNNTIYNTTESGILPRSSSNLHIVNNTIFKTSASGILLYENVNYCTISDNTISNSSYQGIWMNGTTNISINNNSIFNATHNGIISWFSSQLTVSGNNISNCGVYGIWLYREVNNTLVSDNTLFDNYYGIFLERASHTTITSNIILNNTQFGIGLHSASNNTLIQWNNFIDNNLGSSSQAQDNGTSNIFSHNFWVDWTNPDSHGDGIVDDPYLVDGTASNNDSFPLSSTLSAPTVLVPNGSEILNGTVVVQWTAALDSLNETLSYGVYYSLDGSTWIELAFGLTALNYSWDTTTVTDETTVWVKVNSTSSQGDVVEDISDAAFTIRNTPHSLSAPIITSPNGGETLSGSVTIQWTAAVDSLTHPITYAVEYSADGGVTWNTIITGVTATSSSWDTSTVLNGASYLIKVTATDSAGLSSIDTSDSIFTIQNDILTSDTAPDSNVGSGSVSAGYSILIVLGGFLGIVFLRQGKPKKE